MVTINSTHVLLLLFLWILLQPGVLFTLDIYKRSFKFTPTVFFSEYAPHLLLVVCLWAAILYAIYMWKKTHPQQVDDPIETGSPFDDSMGPVDSDTKYK